MKRIAVKTGKRQELVDITWLVEKAVREQNVSSGIAVIYSPHTTAAVTINENADPDVSSDILMKTEKLVDKNDRGYAHSEGNSDAHIKASLVGSSVTVIIDNGRLVLGTWQGIFFAEFDGPRSREIFVKIMAD